MEQALKQRLIGAVILISLAVIFVPMLIGGKPGDNEVVSIDIPELPKELESRIIALPEQTMEPLAKVSLSKGQPVKITSPSIAKPPLSNAVEGISAWVVQVGSFSDKKNAKGLSDQLKKAGFTAFVEQSAGKKGEIYRVRVGPELSEKQAGLIKLKLQQEQKLAKALVVQYP
ncbi:sporulation-like protein [Cycloclasticus sp. 46_83_sub15_T18]|nr:sporulation-like protein [Cycloclasticus sp. 46_83_sub15_T18]OUR81555.1 sporulation-like protein [Cycloclasticus sp. 46_120_T64]